MITYEKFPNSLPILAMVAITTVGHTSTASADNPPPCDPCKLELIPQANPNHLKATVGTAKKAGLKGWEVPVTWNTIEMPQGAFIPECANIDHRGLQAFDGWYVPTTMTKTYLMNSGTTRFAMSDNFYARYFDPCKGGPYKSGGSTYDIVKIKAPTPPPTEPYDPPIDPDDDDGNGEPPIEPPQVDPYENRGDTNEPCSTEPFVPQECSPYQHPDTRTAQNLPAPIGIEFAAENIGNAFIKRGFIQYNYHPITVPVPKYFLEEHAESQLQLQEGKQPESPVGGSITRRVCRLTGELIITEKQGNPSWYGPRPGSGMTITETTATGSFDVKGYDDCPNQQPDTPGVMTVAAALTDEYTTQQLVDDTISHAWEFKGDGYFEPSMPGAEFLVENGEQMVLFQKTKYKIRVPIDPLNYPRPYRLNWIEEFEPQDLDPDDGQIPAIEYKYLSEELQTGQGETTVHTINPADTPDKKGRWFVHLVPTSVALDVNGDGDLNDACDGLYSYLSGYELDQPKLDSGSRFENVQYGTAQKMKLFVFKPEAISADSATLKIVNPTSYSGYGGNCQANASAINEGKDFSFSENGDVLTVDANVENGQLSTPIFCRDYGAWCEVEITWKKNGQLLNDEPIRITLPDDKNNDKIADHWQRGEVVRWNQQFQLSEGQANWCNPNDSTTWGAVFGGDNELADSDGAGPMPAMAEQGDALTPLEEYRGFFLDGGPNLNAPRHHRLSVARKDLLVECSEMDGIALTGGSLPPDTGSGFVDQGNDPNAYAQSYSLTSTMSHVSNFFSQDGPPTGSNPQYFPGAAIDTWWVKDKLNDIGYVVYQNGAMGASHKYSGPYTDFQRDSNGNRERNGWLSIATDLILLSSDGIRHSELYGGGQGVAILANYQNRNTQCRNFVKLALQGRKGFKSSNGNFYAKSQEAAREQDERHEPDRPTYQGAAIFVNSLAEERDLTSQAEFTNRLQISVAHELAHLFVGNDENHFVGDGHLLSANVLGTSFVQDEIVAIKLRKRASINQDANGNVVP